VSEVTSAARSLRVQLNENADPVAMTSQEFRAAVAAGSIVETTPVWGRVFYERRVVERRGSPHVPRCEPDAGSVGATPSSGDRRKGPAAGGRGASSDEGEGSSASPCGERLGHDPNRS